ncbi:MAG: DUF441 domain-containing protein [Snodgrassella sp.]|jgi:uncharacterized membrane protein (DUF441 family)|uniref:UPF0756 membrane protein BHC46_01750 n=2 Tax=Snodgrassella TaxID=1193515 RepID=A0A2N9XLY7_9NEIS|nr:MULTISPECIES: DUF441 domain-containing protein [Snodgrassella]KDN14744.1 putative membrane protein [Snodgrassella communis]MCO6508449.1 DUF441 domain-containing protein [Snodgrassella sp.]MCO6514663.1 DUF441 domain-containing protein [Snodgrassella sp.]MCO6517242.1 DUF441 domain-containing protein [Snodgrassella sp.]MCO6518673.1 DUF441 domain-containing protein [Snodgrassella sp.]
MSFWASNANALLLLLFVALGIVGNNPSVTISALIILLVQQTPLLKYAPVLEKYGLQLGIMLLMIGVLAPLITGKVQPAQIAALVTSWKTIAAVVVGTVVAWLGGRGVQLMQVNPTIVTGLMIGTIIGVAFLRGVPVGPLIAAGLLSLIL